MRKVKKKKQKTYWVCLSNRWVPILHFEKERAMEDMRDCRIAGEDNARIAKVRIVEVKK